VPADAETVRGAVADPLPQALVLTAIVIGFAVLAFTAVLIKRAYQVLAAMTWMT
jgi:multicomponent Na+:H+ antiporter subunit C